MLTVTNDTYITATEVCDMIRKIAAYRDARFLHAVSVVLDNARYQRCRTVQELAAEFNVTLVFLPTYSPNLNLIERLWKLAKSELRVRFYDDFAAFRERIDSILGDLAGAYRERLDNLLHAPHILDNLRQITEGNERIA